MSSPPSRGPPAGANGEPIPSTLRIVHFSKKQGLGTFRALVSGPPMAGRGLTGELLQKKRLNSFRVGGSRGPKTRRRTELNCAAGVRHRVRMRHTRAVTPFNHRNGSFGSDVPEIYRQRPSSVLGAALTARRTNCCAKAPGKAAAAGRAGRNIATLSVGGIARGHTAAPTGFSWEALAGLGPDFDACVSTPRGADSQSPTRGSRGKGRPGVSIFLANQLNRLGSRAIGPGVLACALAGT